MKKAEISIYLDTLRPKKNGKCSVKIRVTYNRIRKYYSTGIDLTEGEFEHLSFGKRFTPEQKEIEKKLNFLKAKADKINDSLLVFTFEGFEEGF